MKRMFFPGLLTASLLLPVNVVVAEDIDLFVGAPTSSQDVPNVLIVIDNTANWSQAFQAEMAALSSVVSNLPENRIRLGFMMFTETGSGGSGGGNGNGNGNQNSGSGSTTTTTTTTNSSGNSNVDGGYVRAAVRLLNSDTKAKYAAMLQNFDVTNDKSNGGKASAAMEEVYRYFSGRAPYAGNNKVKTDYLGNTSGGGAADRQVYALQGNALDGFSGSIYNSPRVSDCAKNFVIYISNSAPMDNNSDATRTSGVLTGFGGDSSAISVSPAHSQDSKIDEWARFMKRDLGMVTYAIEAAKGANHADKWTAQLKSASLGVSNGKYFDVSANPSQANITDALNAIFSEIQSVNSVFASVSLPVSVNTQGTYLNQVFIGMFRPEQSAKPRWPGNLKQYKMGFSDSNRTTLQLQDADSGTAISSSGSGFIYECARSFWTPTAEDSYWNGVINEANCRGRAAGSNTPDGNLVEKGGQGYKTRAIAPASRVVKTCNADCSALSEFNTTNVSKTQLGNASMSDAQHAELVDWAAGKNNARDLTNATDGTYLNPEERVASASATAMRPSVHGDVVHSRPVALNYGDDTEAQRKVVVFYGANDGTLRAVNGNQDGESSIGPLGSSFAPGQELWSFVPPEFFPRIKRLRDNTTPISFPGSTQASARPKPYGMDGAITAYKNGTTARIYATMRRGGRALYAFNVDNPASPQLLWKGGCGDLSDASCVDSDYDEIGQTWSSLKVIKAAGHTAGPLLAMGGGYHINSLGQTCEDTDRVVSGVYSNHDCDSTTRGKRIFIIDAESGDVEVQFTTERSVVADLTVVPDDDGNVAYLYAVDMGGNVYRISGATANQPIGTTAPRSWTLTKIADLGCSTSSDCSLNRKLMFAPDVVVSGDTHYIMFGSGDREKPLAADIYPATAQVNNYFYMIKDKPTSTTWITTANGASSRGWIKHDSLLAIGASNPTQAQLDSKPLGWRLALARGEQVVNSPLTIYGVISFSTSEPTPPAAGQCTSLGTARLYNINYLDASSANGTNNRSVVLPGGGLPPSAVGGMVLIGGVPYPFCIGCNPDSPLQAGRPPAPPIASQPKAKVYWNIEQ